MTRFILPLLLAPLAGCATIVHGGTHQTVGINSSPIGAKVSVDNREVGFTPVQVELTRKHNHAVVVSKEGFGSWSGTLEPSVSGWVWGNIAIGGLIGLGVDLISGGGYQLYPEDLSATLAPAAAAPATSTAAAK